MPLVPAQFVNATVATTRTTYYTVPTGNTAVIRTMSVAYGAGSAVRWIRIWGGGALWADVVVPPNSVQVLLGVYVLTAGQILEAQAETANTLVLHVAGALQS